MRALIYSDLHYGFDDRTNRILLKFFKGVSKIDFDVVINCGDSISHKEHSIEKFMDLQRRYIDKPIVQCIGNHSLWGIDGKDPDWYSKRINLWNKMFQIYNVHHVSECVEIGGFHFAGIDGWYGRPDEAVRVSNDYHWIGNKINGEDTHHYLSRKAQKDLQTIIDRGLPRDKTLYITHFSPFIDNVNDLPYCADVGMGDTLTKNFKWVCEGHSHRYRNDIIDGTTVLNCGANYNDPKFIMLEMN